MFQISDGIFQIGLCIGLIVMAFALFGSPYSWTRKLGILVFVGTSGLAIWFWTEKWWAAALGMAIWFLLPMAQAALFSRRLHFSKKRKLEPGYFTDEEFPEVVALSTELRKLDFKWEGDYWLKPSHMDQGYRLFKHLHEDIYASIAVIRLGGVAVVYMAFISNSQDGTVWLTWDYPLAYGLKMPPHLMIHRCTDATSASQLCEQHREFLKINEVKIKTSEGQTAVELYDNFFTSLIHYNLEQGILEPSSKHTGEISYTWRGTAFVLFQVLREVTSG